MSDFGTFEHICLLWTPYEEESHWEFGQNLGYTWFPWPNPIFISSLKFMISDKVTIDTVHPLARVSYPLIHTVHPYAHAALHRLLSWLPDASLAPSPGVIDVFGPSSFEFLPFL